MKIITRNVNGIRSSIKKGFLETIMGENPDIVCIQEIRAYEGEIPAEIRFILKEYDLIRNAAKKAGYAGTATFYKKGLNVIKNNIFKENELFSEEGRIIETRIMIDDTEYAIINIYVPNGGASITGKNTLDKKLSFYEEVLAHIKGLLGQGIHIICGGDFNVAHAEIDLASPQQNKKSIGFLLAEREKMNTLKGIGCVDVFRHFHPKEAGHYTRWSYRKGIKEANKGRRYDYFFVDENTLPFIKDVGHLTHINASDHCPIYLVTR